jgi:hypothetical protein
MATSRRVVLLVVQHHPSQAVARDFLQFLLVGMIDHPLQLGARRRGVAGIELHFRKDEGGSGRIPVARKFVLERRRGVLGFGDVVRARRLGCGGEQHGRLFRFLAGPPAPALDSGRCQSRDDKRRGHRIAPACPPRPKVVQLFLLLEIVDCHVRPSFLP